MVVLEVFTIISDLTDDSTVSLFLFQGYPTAQMQPYMQQQYYPSYAYTTQQAGAQGTDIDVFYSFFRLHVLPSFLSSSLPSYTLCMLNVTASLFMALESFLFAFTVAVSLVCVPVTG